LPRTRSFIPAGEVHWAELAEAPPSFIRERRVRGRRAEGLRYERKALTHLEGLFGEALLPSPWIKFLSRSGEKVRWCQPDALLLQVAKQELVIIEVKYQHCPEAWYQLFTIYLPVVRVLFPGWKVRVVEMCKWFDVATVTPQLPRLCEDITKAKMGELNVHIWK
jgi:hypothetical protein